MSFSFSELKELINTKVNNNPTHPFCKDNITINEFDDMKNGIINASYQRHRAESYCSGRGVEITNKNTLDTEFASLYNKINAIPGCKCDVNVINTPIATYETEGVYSNSGEYKCGAYYSAACTTNGNIACGGHHVGKDVPCTSNSYTCTNSTPCSNGGGHVFWSPSQGGLVYGEYDPVQLIECNAVTAYATYGNNSGYLHLNNTPVYFASDKSGTGSWHGNIYSGGRRVTHLTYSSCGSVSCNANSVVIDKCANAISCQNGLTSCTPHGTTWCGAVDCGSHDIPCTNGLDASTKSVVSTPYEKWTDHCNSYSNPYQGTVNVDTIDSNHQYDALGATIPKCTSVSTISHINNNIATCTCNSRKARTKTYPGPITGPHLNISCLTNVSLGRNRDYGGYRCPTNDNGNNSSEAVLKKSCPDNFTIIENCHGKDCSSNKDSRGSYTIDPGISNNGCSNGYIDCNANDGCSGNTVKIPCQANGPISSNGTVKSSTPVY